MTPKTRINTREFGRIGAAPNRVLDYSPGPNPQIDETDWRAAMNGTRDTCSTRFWARVDKSSGCWEWTGGRCDGYGIFYPPGGGRYRAHRYAYELMVGKIPPGMVLDHTCHQPLTCTGGTSCPHRACVNPAHVDVVTRSQNRESDRTASPERRRTHCAQGHEFTDVNTYVRVTKRGNKWRQCKACHRINSRDTQRRARAPRTTTESEGK